MDNPANIESLIDISTTLRKLPVSKKRLQKLIAFVASEEKVRLQYVELSIVGKHKMATLNEQFLRHSGATDVISFELAESDNELSGQIIVCWDVAVSQARRRQISPQDELLLYITHGLLHTLGYDDHDADDFRRMHTREQQILENFGIKANWQIIED